MEDNYIQLVYDSLTGLTEDTGRLPGVEDAFAPGSPCDMLYTQAYDAARRICGRLGVDNDTDIELIFQNMEAISRILGCKMFSCGAKFSNR